MPAQVAELVDALVSGTSGAILGGSSPLLGTITLLKFVSLHPDATAEPCIFRGFQACRVHCMSLDCNRARLRGRLPRSFLRTACNAVRFLGADAVWHCRRC